MLYSPTTSGFYDLSIHGYSIPADAVEITEVQHAQLLSDQSAGATIQPDENGFPVAVFPPPPNLAEQITALCLQVDTAADAARLKIAGDPLRVVEYERAATEAQAFKAAGYTGATPPTVASWAEAKNWTAQQAADDILAVSVAWNMAMYALRDIRLKGKEAIRAAADTETATAAATAASDQIQAVLAAMGL